VLEDVTFNGPGQSLQNGRGTALEGAFGDVIRLPYETLVAKELKNGDRYIIV